MVALRCFVLFLPPFSSLSPSFSVCLGHAMYAFDTCLLRFVGTFGHSSSPPSPTLVGISGIFVHLLTHLGIFLGKRSSCINSGTSQVVRAFTI